MLLDNYYVAKRIAEVGGNVVYPSSVNTNAYTSYNGTKTLKTVSNNDFSSTPGNMYGYFSFIEVGSGTTAVAATDKSLVSRITTLSKGAIQRFQTASSLKLVQTFTNNTSDTITINEVGIIGGYESYSSYSAYLSARTVLSTPITLEAGQTCCISFEVSYS